MACRRASSSTPAEWLGQIVVGTGIEAADLVALGPERREHEHRHVAHVPNALQDLPTVEVGQPDVEDHDIGLALMELADPVAAFERLGHLVALPLEEGPEQLADVRLILDDQRGDRSVSHQV